MKKLICAVLCLAILCMSVAAFAADPIPSIKFFGTNGVKATVKGAPAKAGYYSCAIVYLKANFKRGSTMSDAGRKYSKSGQKSVNGGWGQGTGNVSNSYSGNNSADILLSYEATGTYQYYGIR